MEMRGRRIWREKKEKSNFYHHANVSSSDCNFRVVMTFYSQNSVREGMVFEIEKEFVRYRS